MSEQRGREIERRRLRIGINNVTAFSKELGLNRETVVRAEAGVASKRTYQQIEAWLDRHEEEMGIDDPLPPEPEARASEDLIEFRVGGNFGVDVVVKGPVSNLPELEAAVGRIMDRLRANGGDAG